PRSGSTPGSSSAPGPSSGATPPPGRSPPPEPRPGRHFPNWGGFAGRTAGRPTGNLPRTPMGTASMIPAGLEPGQRPAQPVLQRRCRGPAEDLGRTGRVEGGARQLPGTGGGVDGRLLEPGQAGHGGEELVHARLDPGAD